MRRKIDIAHWYWDNFHKRGWLSHRARFLKAKSIPMPRFDNEAAWEASRLVQSRVCFSPKYLAATLRVSSAHLLELANADKEDLDWWKENAPAGSISPIGTFAASGAMIALTHEAMTKGYFKAVTLPYIKATVAEFTLLIMMWLFTYVLPFSYLVSCLVKGVEINWLLLVAVPIVSVWASDIAWKELIRRL